MSFTQLAVTKHHDDEQSSSSIYSTMEPYDPVMSFEDFITDDEDIIDEVQWLHSICCLQSFSVINDRHICMSKLLPDTFR